MDTRNQGRLKELSQFLQSRRARISPEQAGFPRGIRRRTPGLRRAEVAMLAGVSADWYTWLEQGRDIQVSAQVLESLVRALQLDSNESKHLYVLALHHIPPGAHSQQSIVSPALQDFLDQLGTTPALVMNSRFDVVAWNEAACAVYGDYNVMSDMERNAVWRVFTSPYVRELSGEYWESLARRRLAQFRAFYGRHTEEPRWNQFIRDLSEISAEFSEWWQLHDVLDSPEDQKTINHPIAGQLSFNHITFQVNESPDLQVTVNTPVAETDTLLKMRKLLSMEK
ncbi:helix-turn-helix transcriptional regulator [Paenibacillus sp. SI8]|uniref:helix-turn-helix transcriptional regulator n=1 Tax=unclassified Paenibacillus TaxID=185978 RepID=UPI0034664427